MIDFSVVSRLYYAYVKFRKTDKTLAIYGDELLFFSLGIADYGPSTFRMAHDRIVFLNNFIAICISSYNVFLNILLLRMITKSYFIFIIVVYKSLLGGNLYSVYVSRKYKNTTEYNKLKKQIYKSYWKYLYCDKFLSKM